MSLLEKFPSINVIQEIEPEDLAFPLLKVLVEQGNQWVKPINIHNFLIEISREMTASEETKPLVETTQRKITEAWMWLEREILIAPRPGQNRNFYFVTEKGLKLAADTDIQKYRRNNLLRKDRLDPVLASKVMPQFIRGDYDIAVFQAFKEVEVRVRRYSSLSDTDLGVSLMRKAFNSESGVLIDRLLPEAEREATAHLFAGAIGLFKNPGSHRQVDLDDPNECAELIYFANLLLRIVERNKPETA